MPTGIGGERSGARDTVMYVWVDEKYSRLTRKEKRPARAGEVFGREERGWIEH